MTPEIRRAEPDDADGLASLSAELGYPGIASELRARVEDLHARPGHAIFVADSPDLEVIGWIHVCLCHHLESEPFAEVAGLVVAQAHRSSGVGAALLEAAEEWAGEQGMDTIRVRSNVVRERAHRFYLRQGYHKAKEQAVFVKGLD
jgi:GNAT superfamily N-acetyltransferase